jgi:hypothetical protein
MTEEDRINKRAYEIWIEFGKPSGKEKTIWGIAQLQIWREDFYKNKKCPHCLK